MMDLEVDVEGLADLERALLELDKRSTRKAVGRRVLKKAAKPMAADMNARAPKDPNTDGGLSDSYVVSTKLNRRQQRAARREGRDDVYMYVGTNDPAGVQQEFGNVNHPPQPHARPAWEAGKHAVLQTIASELGEEITKTARRQAQRQARLLAQTNR